MIPKANDGILLAAYLTKICNISCQYLIVLEMHLEKLGVIVKWGLAVIVVLIHKSFARELWINSVFSLRIWCINSKFCMIKIIFFKGPYMI